MTSGGFPALHGLRLVQDLGLVQRYDAVGNDGAPLAILVLGEQAAVDGAVRDWFAQHAIGASTATLPGELPITVYPDDRRPWASSPVQPGRVGIERLQARLSTPPFPPHGAPQRSWGAPRATAAAPRWSPHPAPAWGPSQPARSGPSNAPLVVGVSAVAMLVVIGIVAVIVLTSGGDERASTVSAPPGPTIPTTAPPTTTSAQPEPDEERPVLKDVPPVAVLGPAFGPGDDTYTFAFPGWPFAFRAPITWGCISGDFPLPDTEARLCIDEQNPGDEQRVNLILRPCPTTCTQAEQDTMNRDWLDEPDRAMSFDPTTVYVETPTTDTGYYSVDFSHFFAAEPGGPLGWQVGVYVESPPDTRDEVLRILNDIRTQTP